MTHCGSLGHEGSPGCKGSPGFEGSPGHEGCPEHEKSSGHEGSLGPEGSPGHEGPPGFKGSPEFKGSPGFGGNWSLSYALGAEGAAPVPAWLCPAAAPALQPLQGKEYPEEYPGGRDGHPRHRMGASSLIPRNIPALSSFPGTQGHSYIPRLSPGPSAPLSTPLQGKHSRKGSVPTAATSRQELPAPARTAPKSTAEQSQTPQLGCHNPRRTPREVGLEFSPFQSPGTHRDTHPRVPRGHQTRGWVTTINREAANEGTDPEQGREKVRRRRWERKGVRTRASSSTSG